VDWHKHLFGANASMIETADEFENRLLLLDPEEDAFVIHADELIEDLSPSINDKVYEPIFRFFELHPLADCGAPGTLVHHVEDYYPNYVEALIDSVHRKTSYNGVLMIHRILNSDVDDELRRRLFDAVLRASNDATAAPHVREMAVRFVQLHS
jgi:hypothetical protein